MSDTNKAFTYATSVVAKRRSKSITQFDRHYKELSTALPDAINIFWELSTVQNELLKSVFGCADDLDELKQKQQNLSKKLKQILTDNGFSEDYLEIKYHCKKCNDTGIYHGENCTCIIALVSEYSFNKLCDDSIIKNCSFANFRLDYYPEEPNEFGVSPREKMAEILDYCKNYAENFSKRSKSILMFGKTGLGKTHLSLAIASEVAKHGVNVVYGSAQDLLRNAEREYFSGTDETLNSLLECDLLVLDDLGTEFENKFNTSCVYNIINSRLNHSRPTIINTNLTSKELQERYAQRVVSRLIGDFDCLNYLGNDIRQIKSRR